MAKLACLLLAVFSAAALLGPGRSAVSRSPATATAITLNGHQAGAVFGGIGAISGGGGNSRFLIDYPSRQRAQILHYLFGPGGADLQLLKLEIGGDNDSTDGSEPSVEHTRGVLDCRSGYEWWLAKQAVARDPRLKLYGLQWGGPGWLGTMWSKADLGYLISWLNCARSHGLHISYLGGWNEHGYDVSWYLSLRRELDANGYQSVKLVAADAHALELPYRPAYAWAIALLARRGSALRNAIGVLGAHDTCGFPTNGYACESTRAARGTDLPLWETELGGLDGSLGAAALARSINNSYIQADTTGLLTWPLLDSMPAYALPLENRGLVTADQPWSGTYTVNRIAWAIAQTTQFAQPGWRHFAGGNAALGDSGSYDSYESPDGKDWSLVAENTGHQPGRSIRPQTITVRLTGGLADRIVHVWSTNLESAAPGGWFVRQPPVTPRNGTFSYTIPPGFVVSFTSTNTQSHYSPGAPPWPAPMKLPYRARADGSNEAWGMASIEGAFVYRDCLGSLSGRCIEQAAPRTPIWYLTPSQGQPTPYAIVGDPSWTNYTVSAKVLFTSRTGTASLIGHLGEVGGDPVLFSGYRFSVQANGHWQLARKSQYYNRHEPTMRDLKSGAVAAFVPGTWHLLTLGLHDGLITATIGGRPVASVTDRTYGAGLAGIGSNWSLVQFGDLTVS
jgi:hypothetical protein